MNPMRSFWIAVIALALCSCGKDERALESELSEAGYEMTMDGWFEVIRAQNVEVMKKMVKGGFDAQTESQEGRNGLHVAAEAGSIEAAEYLLNLGLPIDAKDENGRTPLMLAVIADQKKMVKWLLQQRADPQQKDNEGFIALMLAVTHDGNGAIEELAPYHREDLDAALLLAALVGNAPAIDSLTNFGASVHARMEDGRTPLMLASQNGHMDAVKILMDVGASRLATTENGDSAQSLALTAGHHEIAEWIEKGMDETALALESDQEVLNAMQQYLVDMNQGGVDTHQPADQDLDATEEGITQGTIAKAPALGSIEGARISKASTASKTGETVESLPLVMRHYHQRELPLELREVSHGSAKIRIANASHQEIPVQEGDTIPRSRLVVVKVFSRIESGKLNDGQPVEIGVVEVEDQSSGQRREWVQGRPLNSHDAVALLEDGQSGQRYIARPGQRFFSEDGKEYVVIDVRPNQMVVEEVTTGETTTLPLRGSRG